ncbi:MAG: LPS assembly lipoprotein LptE, partial [Nitrospinales bacterium]
QVLGCGYHLVGAGKQMPANVKTLAIPVFSNTSNEPAIHRNLTDIVRQTFINDRRLKLVKTSNADLVLKGVLTEYQLRPIAFNQNDIATEYWVYLGIDIEVTDRANKKPFLKKVFRTRWNYKADQDVVDAEASRLEALNQAYLDVGRRLVSIVIDKF